MSPTPDGIAAVVDEASATRRGNEILFHEYAHHFMMQNSTSAAYPGWYIEGFAEYFATVRFTARKIDIGNYSQGRAYSIVQGAWLPMERILSAGPAGLNRRADGGLLCAKLAAGSLFLQHARTPGGAGAAAAGAPAAASRSRRCNARRASPRRR